ncbi:MAG: hypothetical protein NZ761_01135, partial [Dehalococcoidia bacterium]|nr:hypothetical protein [Dehalococcoidia bacterium]
ARPWVSCLRSGKVSKPFLVVDQERLPRLGTQSTVPRAIMGSVRVRHLGSTVGLVQHDGLLHR